MHHKPILLDNYEIQQILAANSGGLPWRRQPASIFDPASVVQHWLTMVRKAGYCRAPRVDPWLAKSCGRPLNAFRFAHGLGSRLGSRAIAFRSTLESIAAS